MNRQALEYSYTLRKQIKNRNIKIILSFTIAIIYIAIVTNIVLFPVRQNADSMNPDIPEKGLVFVTPLLKNPHRGDIVLLEQRTDLNSNVFKKIANAFVYFFTARQINLTSDPEIPGTNKQLRRVVALPGDTLYMKDYKLYVRPQGNRHFLTEFELSDHTYNITFCKSVPGWDESIGVTGDFEEFTLGDDEYFVLSDNRFSSTDSRIWGPVSQKRFGGTALLCYWPFKSFKGLK